MNVAIVLHFGAILNRGTNSYLVVFKCVTLIHLCLVFNLCRIFDLGVSGCIQFLSDFVFLVVLFILLYADILCLLTCHIL